MARPRFAFPSYKLHKPSGQAVMRVTLRGGVRKSVYLGVCDSPESKAEYAPRAGCGHDYAGRRLASGEVASCGVS